MSSRRYFGTRWLRVGMLAAGLSLSGCASYSLVSQDGSTTVRGSNVQIYGTINQSYTRNLQ